MIIDLLKNADIYYGLGDRMKRAFQYLRETDLSKLEPGKYEIDGSEVFALVQHYESRPIENGKWESHKKYIDIQYIFDGTEKMGYAYVNDMKVIQEYVNEKDCMFFSGSGSFFDVKSGMFAVFFPDDSHMPCIAADKPKAVKKVVVKVLV